MSNIFFFEKRKTVKDFFQIAIFSGVFLFGAVAYATYKQDVGFIIPFLTTALVWFGAISLAAFVSCIKILRNKPTDVEIVLAAVNEDHFRNELQHRADMCLAAFANQSERLSNKNASVQSVNDATRRVKEKKEAFWSFLGALRNLGYDFPGERLSDFSS